MRWLEFFGKLSNRNITHATKVSYVCIFKLSNSHTEGEKQGKLIIYTKCEHFNLHDFLNHEVLDLWHVWRLTAVLRCSTSPHRPGGPCGAAQLQTATQAHTQSWLSFNHRWVSEKSRQALPKDTVLSNTKWWGNEWKGLNNQSDLLNLCTIHNLALLVYTPHMIWHLLSNIYFHLLGKRKIRLLKFKRENNDRSGSRWQYNIYEHDIEILWS